MNDATDPIQIGFPAEEVYESLSDLPPPNPEAPRVVFRSGLVLSRGREIALCEHAQKRFQELTIELGRDETECDAHGTPIFLRQETVGDGREGSPDRKFMAKRLLYQYLSENKVWWRPLAYPGSIYSQSNLTVPISRRIARQMGARAINYFFGTDPYFACYPVGGQADEDLSHAVQKLAELKMEWGGSKSRLRNAVELAFVTGESVMKISRETRKSFYRRMGMVGVDESGQVILAPDGREITPEDLWVMDDAGRIVLKRSPEMEKPPVINFQEAVLNEEITHYDGPRISHIYWRDFLCPERAESVESADCVVHLMNFTASALAEAYQTDPNPDIESMQAAAEALKAILSQSSESKTTDASRRMDEAIGEPYVMPEPTTLVGEFYLRFDADGDGYQEDIMLVMDIATGTPIYYDYTAAVTDDGLRPFRVIRPFPVQNRWYGQGAFELFERHQETIDLMVNRRNRAQGEAGRVTFWNPSATLEGDEDPRLKLNWGKTYTLKGDKRPDDVINVVYLDDNKYDHLTQEIEFFLQLALNESGVSHANDNNMAGMDTMKLATGIRNIEKTGMELFAVPISNLETGLTETMEAFLSCMIASTDEDEAFTILEDNVPVNLVLHKSAVYGMRMDVRMMLTRYRDEQLLASSQFAVQVVKEFYALPPELQVILAPFFRRMLTAFHVPNPEQVIVPISFSIPSNPSALPGGQSPGLDAPAAPPPNI